MKKLMGAIIVFGTVAASYSTDAHAILHPYYQRTKEIKSILDNQMVRDRLLSGQAAGSPVSGSVDSVKFVASYDTEEGGQTYQVTSGQCTLDVTIAYKKSSHPGPVPFDVFVSKSLSCPE